MLEYIDNTETVILRRRNKSEIAFPNSLLRPFRSRQRVRVAETIFPSFAAHWYLPMQQSGELLSPLVNEEIIDSSGNQWQIIEVHPSPMNHNWQIVARCYYVPFALDDYFDLLRKVSMNSPTGDITDTTAVGYIPVRCGIAARFSEPVIVFDRENNTKKETVYVICREGVEADMSHFIRLAAGKMYAIEKIKTGVWTEMAVCDF